LLRFAGGTGGIWLDIIEIPYIECSLDCNLAFASMIAPDRVRCAAKNTAANSKYIAFIATNAGLCR
jgi:hypothetical protein